MQRDELRGRPRPRDHAHRERRHGDDDAAPGRRERVRDVPRSRDRIGDRDGRPAQRPRRASVLRAHVTRSRSSLEIVLHVPRLDGVAAFSRWREFRADAGGRPRRRPPEHDPRAARPCSANVEVVEPAPAGGRGVPDLEPRRRDSPVHVSSAARGTDRAALVRWRPSAVTISVASVVARSRPGFGLADYGASRSLRRAAPHLADCDVAAAAPHRRAIRASTLIGLTRRSGRVLRADGRDAVLRVRSQGVVRAARHSAPEGPRREDARPEAKQIASRDRRTASCSSRRC